MRVLDEFVTVFRVVDQFSMPVERMNRALDGFKGRFEAVSALTGAVRAGAALSPSAAVAALSGSSIAVAAVGAALATLAAATAGAVGLFAAAAATLTKLGRAGVETAAEMQRLESIFVALTGSVDRARERMAFLQRFAQTSVFEFPDIVRVASQLEAFGLNIERVLPLISQMAAAFGVDPSNLEQLANAFGRLAAGQFGEAMEAFRRFGISAGDLMAEGIRISASGQIQSSVREVMGALERIIQSRFGRVAAIMGGTLAVQLSNLQDAFTKIKAQIGEAILPVVQQFVSAMGKAVAFLQESGVFKTLGEQIARIAANPMFIETATRALFFAVATLEVLPYIVRAGIDLIVAFFSVVKSVFERLYELLRRIFRVSDGGFGAALSVMGELMERITRRADELMAQFQQFQAGAASIEPHGDYFTRQVNELQQIEQNTRTIAEHTRELVDLQRIALGGGELGRRGISQVARYRLTRYQPRPPEITLEELFVRFGGALKIRGAL